MPVICMIRSRRGISMLKRRECGRSVELALEAVLVPVLAVGARA